MEKIYKRFLREERGNVLVLVAALMVVLIGLTALVIDGGRLYFEKSTLQKAADAAALAGAQELPNDVTTAELQAKNIATANNVATGNSTVQFASDKMWIRVITSSNVDLTFGKIFGISSVPVTASAKVELNPLTSGTGVIPLGLDFSDYDKWKNCTEITLKLPSPSGHMDPTEQCDGSNQLGSGNTGPLNITGSGGDNFRSDLANGSQIEVWVGKELDTETGTMTGPTKQGIKERVDKCKDIYTYNAATFETNPPPDNCAQIVTVPLYTIIESNGNQIKKVKVVGFATLFIIGTDNSGKEVYARFMDFTTGGGNSEGQTDYGTYGFKLVE
ncbi:pilus assembly protein TadG-related protein [Ureibacillus acetophenoni]|uniref:Flp pilus assembly protein TadG n=1 Tax=Ureibacillus acetophenoni TaxID=614649 RepID=A0A285U600_9BACL|nr:pilus assembly protein TadG-related protein [Ureibacillus acetophenoni]SOC37262.1 Flp pilus assembly protein TadG [Ureibacillus acetophenoni]